ncbi:RNA polymerase subunit sigma-54 [Citrobacter sp. NCU1]|nr:RNA polymerase subunit sigma-54 [Citrobacter sp. NCU1]
MNRKDRILQKVHELCQINAAGVTTDQISEQTNISRANVSNYLNLLAKEGVIEKFATRPVLYRTRETITLKVNNTAEVNKEPFQYLLGYNGSLKNQINQAKAAVMYPPKGLHTLITGDTGVGKSLFASLMYKHAVHMQQLEQDAPFIVFNCADYASNPQLLVSHIFGHARGAFTGADRDKPGLISEANGGMLFLDEVHRLPPEGQEMIFYFMDTGTYGCLGETQRSKKSEILLVCATTEEPGSALLSTFLRRIPITINLPSLSERSPEDQAEMLKFLFEIESKRINCAISIDLDSAKAIIGSSFTGNVGKLKSTIQSVCANFFIEKMDDDDSISINFYHLDLKTKVGIFNLNRDSDYQARLQHAIGDKIFVSPDYPYYAVSNHCYQDLNKHDTPFKVYDFIDNKMHFVLEQKLNDKEVGRYITSEINNYLSFTIPKSQQDLDHGISKRTMDFCEAIQNEVSLQLGKGLGQKFKLFLGYHLQNIIENPSVHRINSWTRSYETRMFEEYDSALTIKKRLQEEFDIAISDDEVAYLTILLASLVVHERGKMVHVIVATHGDMIASNMVDIAKKLIGETNISAVNMPLDIRPNQAIEEIKKTVMSTMDTLGFLLLVDMGSLSQAGEIITQDCNIPVRTLDMVSTPLVIEALRRTMILNADLNEIHLSLQHFRGYGANKPDYLTPSERPQAILSICSTGEGIAKKLQGFLRSVLDDMDRKDIHIINLSVEDVLRDKHQLLTEYQILLSVGVIDPQLNVTHIPLSDFFSPKGELAFQSIIGGKYPSHQTQETPVTLTKLAEEYLQDFLVFLNPRKIVPIVMSFICRLKELRELDDFGPNLLNICVHICMALERSLRNETIEYSKQNRQEIIDSEIFYIYQKANALLADKVGICLSDGELLYVVDMIEKR